jgi:hypothetical protein
MYIDERDRLVELLASANRWCRGAEARTAGGSPVRYSDPDAAAWDLTGALCRLFGWQRACILFGQIDKHLRRYRSLHWRVHDEHIESMRGLQEMNDDPGTDHQWLIQRLGSIPAFERPPSAHAASETTGTEVHAAH